MTHLTEAEAEKVGASVAAVIIQEIAEPATLYRVGNPLGEGLWYAEGGIPTGLVHSFGIRAASLPMGHHPVFSDGGFAWISVTDSLETLANWFSPSEMSRLVEYGYRIEVIYATAHRTLTFPEYGYSHQVYRREDLVRIDHLDPSNVREIAA